MYAHSKVKGSREIEQRGSYVPSPSKGCLVSWQPVQITPPSLSQGEKRGTERRHTFTHRQIQNIWRCQWQDFKWCDIETDQLIILCISDSQQCLLSFCSCFACGRCIAFQPAWNKDFNWSSVANSNYFTQACTHSELLTLGWLTELITSILLPLSKTSIVTDC